MWHHLLYIPTECRWPLSSFSWMSKWWWRFGGVWAWKWWVNSESSVYQEFSISPLLNEAFELCSPSYAALVDHMCTLEAFLFLLVLYPPPPPPTRLYLVFIQPLHQIHCLSFITQAVSVWSHSVFGMAFRSSLNSVSGPWQEKKVELIC